MADEMAAAPPPVNDFDDLPIPPMDHAFFDDQNDDAFEDLDFDFSFDDLYLPYSDDFLNPDPFPEITVSDPAQMGSGSFPQPGKEIGDFNDSSRIFKSTSPELRHISSDRSARGGTLVDSSSPEVCQVSGSQSSTDSKVLNSTSPELHQVSGDRSSDVSGYLNIPSPESNGSASISQESGNKAGVLNYPSPESQGSGNCGSNVSEEVEALSNNKSVNSSPSFDNCSTKKGVVDQRIKLEELNSNNSNDNGFLLKRKKESDEFSNSSEFRNNKYRKSNNVGEINSNNLINDEEDKRKARLMRNRESAQLSRQRKKHYVEELEDKVRTMHSTIQDLNAKISYIMAENATLRQQLGGGAVPPPMAPPPPGMYPHPPMMYPWMPCAPPYMMKPQGSQVPLVPIPRLKPQQTVSAPKSSKKGEVKKSEGKTKKVASVSFLGLLFFMFLFGGLVPMVNVKYGGMRDSFVGESGYFQNGFYKDHQGRVLLVNGTGYRDKFSDGREFNNGIHSGQQGHGKGERNRDHGSNEFVGFGNGSEPLVASLYVPRNDKLVKIDGNLIIHSVLASEKAMASREDAGEKPGSETGLAVPGDLAPAIPAGRHPHLYRSTAEPKRALGSGSADSENLKSKGRLQQWFREGLAGPMLSSGMCTEVFHFDVSSSASPGAIIPAPPGRNVSMEQNQNSTRINRGKNRRTLHGLSVPGTSHNISQEHATAHSQKDNFGNNSLSSMVVSVLVDPREAGDADGDGMMGTKSLGRIFVVVLIDSVKYVTYSCMLPFKGASTHLVTT